MSGESDYSLLVAAQVEARRFAIEAIATLVNIKKTCANLILRPAGVPEDLIRQFLTERDPATGTRRSKRDAGSIVFAELARTGTDLEVASKIVAIASEWTALHLAQNEYNARGLVQKAGDLRRLIEMEEASERSSDNMRRASEELKRQHEQHEARRRENALLLQMFDAAARIPAREPSEQGVRY